MVGTFTFKGLKLGSRKGLGMVCSRSAITAALGFKESRSAEGKHVDPAGWHQERLRKQLATNLSDNLALLRLMAAASVSR